MSTELPVFNEQTKEPEEITFKLTKGVKYGNKGNEVEGTFIKLLPPTAKQLKQCVPLKQAFCRAVAYVEDKVSDEKLDNIKDDGVKKKVDGNSIMSAIYMSDVDMYEVFLHAKELFNSNIALMEGEVKMTKPMLEDMSNDDFENMIGEYMANFIVASLLTELN